LRWECWLAFARPFILPIALYSDALRTFLLVIESLMRRKRERKDSLKVWPYFTDIIIGLFMFVILTFIILLMQGFFSSASLSETTEILTEKNKEIENLRSYAAPIRPQV